MRAFFAPSVLLAALVAPAGASAAMDYTACIDLVARNPAAAVRQAGEWARFGGGPAARHCYALALVASGAARKGAAELIAIARTEPGLKNASRADMLAQAGELLLEANDLKTAGQVAGQAVKLGPKNPRALAIRAAVALRAGKVREALRDLDAAVSAGKPTARLLSLRAAANRRLGRMTQARADSLYALEVDPGHVPAWIERGRAEAKLGDRHAARQSFLKAISLDRDGAIGASARRALQAMEAGYDE